MFKRILALVDEKITSEVSARYALKFAKINNAFFLICLIHKKGTQFERSEQILQKIFLEAEKIKIKTQGIIKTGDKFEELKEIIKKENVEIVFLPDENLRKIFELPCSVVNVKIVNLGKILPKKILLILKGKISQIKEKAAFLENIAKIFHAKFIINYFGNDKDIENFFSILKDQGIKFESKIFPKFSYKTAVFQALSKKVGLVLIEIEKPKVFKFLKSDYEKFIENPPCNLITFRLYQKE